MLLAGLITVKLLYRSMTSLISDWLPTRRRRGGAEDVGREIVVQWCSGYGPASTLDQQESFYSCCVISNELKLNVLDFKINSGLCCV
jgi:hypothetical protein